MNILLRAAAALSLAILLAAPASASTKAAGAGRPHARQTTPTDLYSLRARRRAQKILELELYQLRINRFEAVRRVILRRLPPDSLTRMP